MKVILEFKNSHHYEKEYKKSDLYCPFCGKQEVWEDQGCGDYYHGVDYNCSSCNSSHSLDNSSRNETEAYSSISRQLRDGVAIKPTTKKGN